MATFASAPDGVHRHLAQLKYRKNPIAKPIKRKEKGPHAPAQAGQYPSPILSRAVNLTYAKKSTLPKSP
jgi:hypothetical protein